MFFIRFKRLCDENGTNPTRVCKELLNISKSTVSYWKNTEGFTPDIDIVDAIAEYFGVTSDWLRCKTDMRRPVRADISSDDIKFALFGGDSNITDEMYEEVLRYAQYIKSRKDNDD